MGCHHEISNGRGVTTIIDAGGLKGGCSICREEKLLAENERLKRDAVTMQESAHRGAKNVEKLLKALRRIANQGPNRGVDGEPWEHWQDIAQKALNAVGVPLGSPSSGDAPTSEAKEKG